MINSELFNGTFYYDIKTDRYLINFNIPCSGLGTENKRIVHYAVEKFEEALLEGLKTFRIGDEY